MGTLQLTRAMSTVRQVKQASYHLKTTLCLGLWANTRYLASCSTISLIKILILKIRYHHDGKYNVLTLAGPFDVYGMCRRDSSLLCAQDCHTHTVEKPSSMDFEAIRASLMRIVPLCLDSDPSLIPRSCMTDTLETLSPVDHDPDDFSFWSESQAKRICTAIEQAFGVEYAPEVIVADANLTTLANRILLSKSLWSS